MTTDSLPIIYDKDFLNRESLSDILTNLINTGVPTANNNSFVIALNSPWDCDKTCLIDNWRNGLQTGSVKFNVIKYNVWENEDSSNLLLSIICSFNQLLGQFPQNKRKELEDNIVSIIDIVLSGALKAGTNRVFGLQGDVISDKISESVKLPSPIKIYQRYNNSNMKKEKFREIIRSFIPENGKLVIFIDELDKCYPAYAIDTLENVKHFFDIENVVFVFSVDLPQLCHSIAKIYKDINCERYLQHFFDRELFLPDSDLDAFLKRYFSFTLDEKSVQLESDMKLLKELTQVLSLSIRDLEFICLDICTFYDAKAKFSPRIYSDDCNKFRTVYTFLFVLRYNQPLLYADIIENGVDQTNPIVVKIFALENAYISNFLHFYLNYNDEVGELSINMPRTPVFEILSTMVNGNRMRRTYSRLKVMNTSLLYWDEFGNDILRFPSESRNLTLSDAIRNNMKKGSMF
ncbi:MAG TPA: P-loop NTPase fold protein [Methanocorpusculum sp.]|nr:P-loop NTPase fold protein [Methanocorpusculum sp.]